MYPSERKRMADVAEFASKAFARHEITQNVSQGLYRHWRCARPDSGMYAFNIITEPGRLIVTGDIGEIILCREPDMLAWLPMALRDPHYLAGKVQAGKVREWCADVAREWIDAEVKDLRADFAKDEEDGLATPEDRKRFEANLKKYDDLRDETEMGPSYFEAALHQSGLIDGCDWPRLETFTTQFLWIVEALRWFLAHVEEGAKQ